MQRHVAFVKAQKSGVRLRTVTLARNDNKDLIEK